MSEYCMKSEIIEWHYISYNFLFSSNPLFVINCPHLSLIPTLCHLNVNNTFRRWGLPIYLSKMHTVYSNMPTAKIRIPHTAKQWKIVSILSTDFVAEDNITSEGVGFFAILDGHGGSDVSEYCAKNLPQVSRSLRRFSRRSMKRIAAVPKAFLKGSAKEWISK